MNYNTPISKRDREIVKTLTMIGNVEDFQDYEFMAKYLIDGLSKHKIGINHYNCFMLELSEHMHNIA